MNTPQIQSLNPTPTPKVALGLQKVKNDHKIKSNSKAKIGENIENKSCSTT